MTETEQLQQIARDLDLCDVGLALTTGKLRRQYARHRKACFAAIAQMNETMPEMTDDELLAALTA